MRSRFRFAILAVLVIAAGCSGSASQGGNLLEAAQDLSPAAPLPSPTPLATTAPVLDAPKPLPTAIALSEATGFVVTPTPEGGAPDDGATAASDDGEVTYNEAVGISPTPTYNEAVGIPPTPTYNEAVGISPTPTPVAQNPQPTTPPTSQSPTPTPQPTADSNNQAVNVTNGGEVYTLNCARCHGADGQGDLGYRGVLGVGAQFGFAGLVEELTNGHPFTFGFGDKLSPQEINDVVAYVTATFG